MYYVEENIESRKKTYNITQLDEQIHTSQVHQYLFIS